MLMMSPCPLDVPRRTVVKGAGSEHMRMDGLGRRGPRPAPHTPVGGHHTALLSALSPAQPAGLFPLTALQPAHLTLSTGSILWPRSCTGGCCSSGAPLSFLCAWATSSMSWGECGGGVLPPPSPQQGPLDQHAFPLCRPDAAMDPWLHDLWEKVRVLHPMPLSLSVIPPGVP